MYRCQKCKKVVPPHTKAHRLVVATRHKRYPKRACYHAKKCRICYRDYSLDPNCPRKTPIIYDYGGTGCEIVREITVCPECASNKDIDALAQSEPP